MTDPTAASEVDALLAAGAAMTGDNVTEYWAESCPDAIAAVVPDGYRLHIQETELDRYLPRPKRKTGHVTVVDARSWLAYWAKHKVPGESEVFADVDTGSVTAYLNSHSVDEPGWGDHRCVLALRETPVWRAWTSTAGRLMTQSQFAEFVDEHAAEFRSPDGSTMLQVAQTLQANTRVSWDAGYRLLDGQRSFSWKETTEARAGSTGHVEIPATFTLVLQVWEGGPVTEATARLRYRVNREGGIEFGYLLDQVQETKAAVFRAITREIQDGIGDVATVLNGAR